MRGSRVGFSKGMTSTRSLGCAGRDAAGTPGASEPTNQEPEQEQELEPEPEPHDYFCSSGTCTAMMQLVSPTPWQA